MYTCRMHKMQESDYTLKTITTNVLWSCGLCGCCIKPCCWFCWSMGFTWGENWPWGNACGAPKFIGGCGGNIICCACIGVCPNCIGCKGGCGKNCPCCCIWNCWLCGSKPPCWFWLKPCWKPCWNPKFGWKPVCMFWQNRWSCCCICCCCCNCICACCANLGTKHGKKGILLASFQT